MIIKLIFFYATYFSVSFSMLLSEYVRHTDHTIFLLDGITKENWYPFFCKVKMNDLDILPSFALNGLLQILHSYYFS